MARTKAEIAQEMAEHHLAIAALWREWSKLEGEVSTPKRKRKQDVQDIRRQLERRARMTKNEDKE